ncbi:hypothetical protein Cni_G29166 [Canna indica]|uniref:Uncharacterized protein n=1 Tax=Canna indica TaxID=4628 RepID=A0AAQ3QPD7_9LILI|nr:hypothetical protein Cni_G29166 [Canna indica]
MFCIAHTKSDESVSSTDAPDIREKFEALSAQVSQSDEDEIYRHIIRPPPNYHNVGTLKTNSICRRNMIPSTTFGPSHRYRALTLSTCTSPHILSHHPLNLASKDSVSAVIQRPQLESARTLSRLTTRTKNKERKQKTTQ